MADATGCMSPALRESLLDVETPVKWGERDVDPSTGSHWRFEAVHL